MQRLDWYGGSGQKMRKGLWCIIYLCCAVGGRRRRSGVSWVRRGNLREERWVGRMEESGSGRVERGKRRLQRSRFLSHPLPVSNNESPGGLYVSGILIPARIHFSLSFSPVLKANSSKSSITQAVLYSHMYKVKLLQGSWCLFSIRRFDFWRRTQKEEDKEKA